MTEKLRLDLGLVLPRMNDARDACIERLNARLRGRAGVDDVHVRITDGGAAELCIHFDPERLSLPRVRQLVRAAGAELSGRFGHLALQIPTANERKARALEDGLKRLPGVLAANASSTGLVHVEFDRELTSETQIKALLPSTNSADGVADPRAPLSMAQHQRDESSDPEDAYGRSEHSHDETSSHSHSHGGGFWTNQELIFSLACGVLLALGFTLEKLSTAPELVRTALYVIAYFFGGYYTTREAVENLRRRKFEIDTLMLVAAAGAAALGAWAEGALLLFLFSLGHALEHFAMGRAKRAIEALAKLAPKSATVLRGEEEREVPIEELAIGDIVLVRPNSRVPADGFVTRGESSVNQAPVTGESIPVDKCPVPQSDRGGTGGGRLDSRHRLFAGTINGSGALEMQVTKRSVDTTLAKVVQMVSEAEAQKSPTQRFTEKFERIFVPAVLALAVMLLFAGAVVDEPFRDSFYRAMAVLVAASPCALAIATPSAILSGVARAARSGILVKGGAPLEDLGSLTALAFDKTGTLTSGHPRITDVMPVAGVDEQELLRAAVAVERLSDHPLAQAIARDGAKRLVSGEAAQATEMTSLTGRGVRARLDGTEVLIGKAEMFGADGIAELSAATRDAIVSLRERGRTTMVVRLGDRDLGAIGLMDTPREAARPTLERLRQLGMKRLIMISGDHQKVADAVAKQVGLDDAWGDLMPEDKVGAIKKLRDDGKVAMVGDGVNDAPAMANATVGIAMGAAGSDVALETADVALMADDLSRLPFAVDLSRSTRRIILQNLVVSLGVVCFLVPATIMGLGIGAAVAVHEGSTLVVVFNALRLLAHRDRFA